MVYFFVHVLIGRESFGFPLLTASIKYVCMYVYIIYINNLVPIEIIRNKHSVDNQKYYVRERY